MERFKFIYTFEAPGPDGELEEREGVLVFSVGTQQYASTDAYGHETEMSDNHSPAFESWSCLYTDEVITDENRIPGDWTGYVKYDDPV